MASKTQEARRQLIEEGIVNPTVEQLRQHNGQLWSAQRANRSLVDQTVQNAQNNVVNQPVQVNMPTDTQGNFDMALRNVLYNRLAQKYNQPLISGGQQTVQGLMTLPEEIAATPGWAGLNLSQARRLQTIEEGGLQSLYGGFTGALGQRQRRLEELGGLASKAFSERLAIKQRQEEIKRQGKQKLEARRQSIAEDFVRTRKSLAEKGVNLNIKAGNQYMTAIMNSDNPEEILDRYIATAFAQPRVQESFLPTSIRRAKIKKPATKKTPKGEQKSTLKFDDL